MATCNVEELMADAACWFCLEAREQEALELQLLCEIYTAIVNATS
jgi:hypothetical protein